MGAASPGRGRRTSVVLSWSGGKDSCMALAALRADPTIEVTALLTTITTDYDRISIHGIRRSILEAQVRAISLPLIESKIPASASNATYEESLTGALAAFRLAQPDTLHIAFGDLFLTDVRAYREDLLSRIGWTPIFPLWGRDTHGLAREFVRSGYGAVITCVDTTQLGAEFAGRSYDDELLAELPGGVDPCGELGEFHTCVYNGPLFGQPLVLKAGQRLRRDERFEYCDFTLSA
jgi:uncharacterized protein (TIGR00290 family)